MLLKFVSKKGLSKLIKVVRLIQEEMQLTINLPNYQRKTLIH